MSLADDIRALISLYIELEEALQPKRSPQPKVSGNTKVDPPSQIDFKALEHREGILTLLRRAKALRMDVRALKDAIVGDAHRLELGDCFRDGCSGVLSAIMTEMPTVECSDCDNVVTSDLFAFYATYLNEDR